MKARKVECNFDRAMRESLSRLVDQGQISPEDARLFSAVGERSDVMKQQGDKEIKKEWKWYVDELMSEDCSCGKTKKRHYSFCYGCYKALPVNIQEALYKRIGEGYEEAFEEAVKYLERYVW